jgi:DNA-binding CsgD family transcriptional regulator
LASLSLRDALPISLRDEPRAWHLAAAAVGPDEDAALALEGVGSGSAARRAFGPAAAALERAARLSPDAEHAARRLLAAGQAAAAAGAPDRALTLLDDAARRTAGAGLRARAAHLRGRIMAWSGSPAEATALLVPEAERVSDGDRVLAATMLADAAIGSTQVNDYVGAEELVRRAAALLAADGEPAERVPVLAVLGWVLVLRGKTAEGRPVVREAERLARDLDPLGPQWLGLHLLLRALTPLEELERARSDATALCEQARDAGALTPLGGALIVAADVTFRLGDWRAADTAAREAIRVSSDAGQPAFRGHALSTHARLTAARGLEHETRAAMSVARELAESHGVTTGMRYVHAALGFLELTLGRADEAADLLAPIERLLEGSGHEDQTTVPWAADLIEAHVRQGAEDEARRALATLERRARASGSAFAGAVAARCRGMLDEDFDPAFAAALACDDRRPMPFERARTLLTYGRRLHRAKRRAEARDRLREAQAGFERLGATAWAAQAQSELRAAGARRRRVRTALTPQEMRVAAAVRGGATNREIAAQLFLSPRTVEFQLTQIYRKLGIRSRTQLVAALERRGSLSERQ